MFVDPKSVFVPDASEQIDFSVLQNALADMSDDELAELEDDLDFCNFAGVPSPRVLEILEKVVDLDAGWKGLLEKNARLALPKAY